MQTERIKGGFSTARWQMSITKSDLMNHVCSSCNTLTYLMQQKDSRGIILQGKMSEYLMTEYRKSTIPVFTLLLLKQKLLLDWF